MKTCLPCIDIGGGHILMMMLKSPLLSALAAIVYITIVASVMNYASQHVQGRSFIVPVAVVSLFTLSAGVMGYLFLYQPVLLFLDNKKKDAVQFFLQSLGIFAGITFLIFILLFAGVVR